MARDNKSLGTFTLDGVPPAPRGVPQIEVTFDLDANGILTVTAKDKATGKTQSITISGSTGLSKEEIEKMKEEAEKNAETDKQVKERIEAKNRAEHLVYTAEKSLKDMGDKVKPEMKKDIEDKSKELKDLIAKEDADPAEIDKKTGELSEHLQKIGQEAYKDQAGAKQGAPNEAGEQPKEEGKKDEKKDVEEGEVVE
jgi:molecular chaperone DnaK